MKRSASFRTQPRGTYYWFQGEREVQAALDFIFILLLWGVSFRGNIIFFPKWQDVIEKVCMVSVCTIENGICAVTQHTHQLYHLSSGFLICDVKGISIKHSFA